MPRKKKDDEHELLTRQQVADMFHVSTKTVTRRVQARLLPPPMRGTHQWTRRRIWDHIERLDKQQQALARDKAPQKKAAKKKKVAHRKDNSARVRAPGV